MIVTSWWFRATFVVVVLSALFYLVSAAARLWGFIGDLLLIFFLAWLVGAVIIHAVNGLMRIPHMRRPVAIVIIYSLLLALVALFAFLVIPQTVSQVLDLTDRVPEFVARLPEAFERIEEILAGFGIRVDLENQVQIESVNDLADRATAFVSDNAVMILQDVISAVFGVSLIIVISFYIVLDGGRRLNEALKVLPPGAERETRFVLYIIDDTFHGYVRGMLVISMIYGVGTWAVMFERDLPAALPVAILSSLLLAAPFIGDWLALALPLTVAALSGDFITFIVVLAVLLFIQQVMINLLSPRILGQAVHMPAMLVVMAVVLGARLIGVSGALLGVPVAGVLYRLAVHYGTQIRERREAQEAEARLQQAAEASGGDTPDSVAASPDGASTQEHSQPAVAESPHGDGPPPDDASAMDDSPAIAASRGRTPPAPTP